MALNIANTPIIRRSDIPAGDTKLLKAFDDVAKGKSEVQLTELPAELRGAAHKLIGASTSSTNAVTNAAQSAAGSIAARNVRTVDASSFSSNPTAVKFRDIIDAKIMSLPGSGLSHAKDLATLVVHNATKRTVQSGPAVLVMAGAYGTGKSVFANAVCEAKGIPVGDTTGKVVRIDCGSIDANTIESWLGGTAQGYVGFGKQPPLTSNTEVLIIDDLDKKSAAEQKKILNAVNGLMAGTPVQRGDGSTIVFNGLVIVNGNFGADEAARLGLKGQAFQDHCKSVAVKECPQNMVSRMASGGIVGIEPVDLPLMKEIAKGKLAELVHGTEKGLLDKRVDAELKVSPEISDVLAQASMNETRGARPLVGLIDLVVAPMFGDIANVLLIDKLGDKPNGIAPKGLDDQRFELRFKQKNGATDTTEVHAFLDAIKSASKDTDLPTLPPQYTNPSSWPLEWVDRTSAARFEPASKPSFAIDGVPAVPLSSGTVGGVGYVVVNAGDGSAKNEMFFVRKAGGKDEYFPVKSFPDELKSASAMMPVQSVDLDDKHSLFVGFHFPKDGGKAQAYAFVYDADSGSFTAKKPPPVRQGAAFGANNGQAVLFSGKEPTFHSIFGWSVPVDASPYDLNGKPNVELAHVYDPKIDEWLAVPLPQRKQKNGQPELDARAFAVAIPQPDGTIAFACGEETFRPSGARDEVSLSRSSNKLTVIDPKKRAVVEQGEMGFAASHVKAFLDADGRIALAGGFDIVDGGTTYAPRDGIYSRNPRSGRWHEKGTLPGGLVQAGLLAVRHPDGIVIGPLAPSESAPDGYALLKRD